MTIYTTIHKQPWKPISYWMLNDAPQYKFRSFDEPSSELFIGELEENTDIKDALSLVEDTCPNTETISSFLDLIYEASQFEGLVVSNTGILDREGVYSVSIEIAQAACAYYGIEPTLPLTYIPETDNDSFNDIDELYYTANQNSGIVCSWTTRPFVKFKQLASIHNINMLGAAPLDAMSFLTCVQSQDYLDINCPRNLDGNTVTTLAEKLRTMNLFANFAGPFELPRPVDHYFWSVDEWRETEYYELNETEHYELNISLFCRDLIAWKEKNISPLLQAWEAGAPVEDIVA